MRSGSAIMSGSSRWLAAALTAIHRAVEDAEDVALSAIHGLCAGAAARPVRSPGRPRRPLAASRGHHRQENPRAGDSDWSPEARWWPGIPGQSPDRENQNATGRCRRPVAVHSKEPTPESAAIIQEQFQELLESLGDPTLRQVALWRMDGLTNAEIAEKMGCVLRTVERKIERIRLIWEEIGAVPTTESPRFSFPAENNAFMRALACRGFFLLDCRVGWKARRKDTL